MKQISWTEFHNLGFLWFANLALRPFGYAINIVEGEAHPFRMQGTAYDETQEPTRVRFLENIDPKVARVIRNPEELDGEDQEHVKRVEAMTVTE